jgi:hypothetical protein
MVLPAGRSRGWRVRHSLHFALRRTGDREAGAGQGDRRKCPSLRGTAPLLLQRFCDEHIENIVALPARPNAPMFFTFPDDARWNAERQAVEFGVEIGEYRGVVRVPRRVFQRLLPETPTPERCVEAYHLQRTRFEKTAERKLRRRQLTEDGNVEITGRDLREGTPMASRSARLR